VLGWVNLTWRMKVMTVAEAARRHLDGLRAAVSTVEQRAVEVARLHGEHELAAGAAGLAQLMGLGGLGQRQGGVDHHPELPAVDQGGQALQPGVVGLHQQRGDAHAALRGGGQQRRRGAAGDRDQRAAGFDRRQQGEAVVGAKAAEEVVLGRAGGR
jgi:hypothetical protein